MKVEPRSPVRVTVFETPRTAADWQRARETVERDAATWTYVGRHASQLYATRGSLARSGAEIALGDELDRAVEDARCDLIALDARGLGRRAGLLWQTSELAERNPYGRLVVSCCLFVAACRLLDRSGSNLVLVVDEWRLGREIAEEARRRGFDARHETVTTRLRPFPDVVKPFVHNAFLLARATSLRPGLVRRTLAVKREMRRRRGAGDPAAILRDADVVLSTWAEPSTFAPGRQIDFDTFFGRLPELLRNAGLRVGYLANPMSWVADTDATLASVAHAGDRVVVTEELVSRRDAVKSALRTLLQPVRVPPIAVAGVDVTAVIAEVARVERRDSHQYWSLLHACVGHRLREAGCRPRSIVLPWENQSWQRALQAGITGQISETTVVGYLNTPISPNWISYFPPPGSFERRELPNRVVVPGPYWRRRLLDHHYAAESVVAGPAFRFERALGAGAEDRAASAKAIVVAPPIDHEEALELVTKCLRAFARLPDVSAIVKLHPRMAGSHDALFRAACAAAGLDDLPSRIAVSQLPMDQLLRSAAVLVYSNSTAAYEALAAGLCLILVRSDFRFDLDPLPPEARIAVRTPDELADAVGRAAAEDEAARQERRTKSHAMIADLLSPVVADSWQLFV